MTLAALVAMLQPVFAALLAVLTNPQAMLGAGVSLVLLVRDFEGTTQKLAKEAIPAAEKRLDLTGEEKLNLAVDYVISLLPAMYFHGIPKQILIPAIEKIVQMVFESGFSHLEHSLNGTVPAVPSMGQLPPAPPAPPAPEAPAAPNP
jgi:hypothetical protein